MRALTIAIDGPAAGGKGTIAKHLARRLGYRLIDTGAMYRAVAWAALQEGIDLNDGEALGALAARLAFTFLPDPDNPERPYRLLVNGTDVTTAIREPAVERASSVVAQYPQVRRVLAQQQRRLAEGGGVVMEGRDITTVVLPDADLKLFITATLTERAHRRYAQYVAQGHVPEGSEAQALARTLNELWQRDRRDTTRETAPMRIAVDSIVVDTTGLTVEETVEALWRLVQSRQAAQASKRLTMDDGR